MGHILKKAITRALPEGARLTTRGGKTFAEWKDGHVSWAIKTSVFKGFMGKKEWWAILDLNQ